MANCSKINFSTAQRAFVAYNILREPLEHLNDEARAFHAAEAFMDEMTSTEDLLGWLFALREWKPGELTKSLWPLLHKIQVGSDKYSEEAAAELLNSLDANSLRALLHVPTDDELTTVGFPKPLRDRIHQAMPASLEGLRRLVKYRHEGSRLRVRGFNKLKHHFLALRMDDGVRVPVWEGLEKNPGYVSVATLALGIAPADVRLLASRAIIGQAMLNGWLGIVLSTRYGETYESPQWVINSLQLRGWREETP